MTEPCDCQGGGDPRALVRDGTDRPRRTPAALDPTAVRVDERRTEHAMVFAAAYASYLRFVSPDGSADRDWHDFFASDALARIAVVAIEDVAVYRTRMKEILDDLENPDEPPDAAVMKRRLRAVFDIVGTLARRIDEFAEALPAAHPLRATVRTLIRGPLSPALRRLIGAYRAGVTLGAMSGTAPARTDVTILGRHLRPFRSLATKGLSAAWPAGVDVADWRHYYDDVDLVAAARMYGDNADAAEQANHVATHNLFRSACDAFLAALGRLVDEARAAIRDGAQGADHQPHYALFLAFLALLEHARVRTDALPGAHLDFYYRRVLGLRERPAEPAHAHVLAELAKHVDTNLVAAGTLIKAGKDATGAELHFAVDRDLVANRAVVTDVKRLYRHPSGQAPPAEADRLFADTVAREKGPWHPFAEKVFADGVPARIAMPHAEVGFAIASHHLWLAAGTRFVALTVDGFASRDGAGSFPAALTCRFTTEKGWLEKTVDTLDFDHGGLLLAVTLDGGDPPIVPYRADVHGFGFDTSLPVMTVTAVNEPSTTWSYPELADLTPQRLTLSVDVTATSAFTLANDQGPVDTSKPFLPFGAMPTAGSGLVIGSKEAMQKQPSSVKLSVDVMQSGVASGPTPGVAAYELVDGGWSTADFDDDDEYVIVTGLSQPLPGTPDLGQDAPYSVDARSGFVRLQLNGGYGTDTYPLELAKFIAGKRDGEPVRPVLPLWQTPRLSYSSTQEVSGSEANGRFFHLTPFGHVEQTPKSTSLMPRFTVGDDDAEGELLLGITSLEPPQNLAVLFQVVDGTADPRVVKPDRHVRWSYLARDEWADFDPRAVADDTDGLLASGIITFAVPAEATVEHTLMPSGQRWIRASVSSTADAVCRLAEVSAQALHATAVDAERGPQTVPPGTLAKLAIPDAAVKGLTQRHSGFGGRPAESRGEFAARVSERLRHRGRPVALWDYEHLVLDAFPGIFSARCLNHTRFEPSSGGEGIYQELAAGHVTVVTIPDLAVPDARDPLRPATSLRLLSEIERFLAARTSCFATLHVRNPQFEQVRTDLRVRFHDGVDETFHVNLLKREITKFLSPWAFRDDARPGFNGRIHSSVLVDFIEERSYVDYVTDVHLFRLLPGATVDGPPLEAVTGSRAVSILVSVPAAQHRVAVIRSDDLVGGGDDCGCAKAVV